MKTAEAIAAYAANSRVHRYGQVFAHLYPTQIWVYNTTAAFGPQVVDIPKEPNEAERVSIYRRAEIALNDLGWSLGVDGWRTPLDSSKPMLATAHLYPLWPVR